MLRKLEIQKLGNLGMWVHVEKFLNLAIFKFWNLNIVGIWKFGNLEIGKSGNLRMWKSTILETVEIWESGNP